MGLYPYKKQKKDRGAKRGKPCENETETGGKPTIPRVADSHEKLADRPGEASSEPPEKTDPDDTLISYF